MMPAWLCPSPHCLGVYCLAGDRLSCTGCGCFKFSFTKEKGLVNFPFYLSSMAVEILELAGREWFPGESAMPKHFNTDNQKCNRLYLTLKTELQKTGNSNGLSDAKIREMLLPHVRKSMLKGKDPLGAESRDEDVQDAEDLQDAEDVQDAEARPDELAFKPKNLHFSEYNVAAETMPSFEVPQNLFQFHAHQLVKRLGLKSKRDVDITRFPFRNVAEGFMMLDPGFPFLEKAFSQHHFDHVRSVRRLEDRAYNLPGLTHNLLKASLSVRDAMQENFYCRLKPFPRSYC
jgi:hypothetical protein